MVINPNELAGARKAVDTSGDETQQTVSPPTKAEDFGAMSPEDFETTGDQTDQSSGYDSATDNDMSGGPGAAKGMLVNRKKLKAIKKMKRGGLASKK